jgi:two-component system, LytTR family, sensor kinase
MQNQKNSQSRINKILSAQNLKHLAYFGLGCLSWLGFSYLFVLYSKIPRGRSIYDFPWSWDAPIWTFGFCFVGAFLIILTKWTFGLLSEKSKNVFRDFIVLLCLIPVNSLILNAFSILVLKAKMSGGERPIEWDWVMGFISLSIIQSFVCLTCIGYFYLDLVNKTKERLSQAQLSKTAMELKSLQQNIEPHFLFNNLNVLSSLIDSNPKKANDFLSKLAELYRYVLQAQNVETVSLNDELEFAKDYIFLMKTRFGDAYEFDWMIDENEINERRIVPVSLQTLLENAVKHNSASSENPLRIIIKLTNDFLITENEIRDKNLTFQTNQSGLNNLKTRYAFLTDKSLEISQSDAVFSVKLPLL